MRFTARALIDEGRRTRAASASRSNATCSAASACAATASSARCSSAVTGRSSLTPRRAPAAVGARAMTAAPARARPSPCGSSPPATAASSACSTARTSCWHWPARVRIAYFTEMTRAEVDGPYDLSLVEGSITHRRATSSASRRCAASRRTARDDRSLRHRRRHPGPAQLRRRRRVRLAVYAHPEYISDPRRPRRRSPLTCRSTSSCTAARSTAASCSK